LRGLVKEGYRVVVFTNQGGVEQGHIKVTDLKAKFGQIAEKLDISILFLGATATDGCKKPMTGMWELFTKELNGGIQINKKKSFYCGDAAGRPKTAERKKDFADTDLKFALNVGLDFKTPE